MSTPNQRKKQSRQPAGSGASPGTKKKSPAVRKKDDGSEQAERRAQRVERITATAGVRLRAKAVFSRGTRDTDVALNRPEQQENDGQVDEAATTDTTVPSTDADAATAPSADDSGSPERNLKKKPVIEADDGTELWDGSTPPDVDEAVRKAFLKDLKPKYDIGKGRMVYPTGEINALTGAPYYMPLPEEASEYESQKGLFASIVPEQPLDEFAKEKLSSGQFEAGGKTLEAYSLEDVKKAFSENAKFVLQSQRSLDHLAQNAVSLQQQWV